MTITMRFGGSIAMLAVAAFVAGCGGGDDSAPRNVPTTFGPVVGGTDPVTSAAQWLGIPFAKAPVGDLRWKAPVDPAPWTTALQANKFGNGCMQHGRIYGPGLNNTYDDTVATSLNTPVGSEDCLTLNVWRPDTQEKNLPVIYFFYGGSNVSGFSADPGYNGAALANKANAVVVTANYRVGIFGWYKLTKISDGNALDDSGNFGTLDTIKALEFMKTNAKAFGGNPDNITVMGQSAGAVNVYAIMASPKAAGLIQKAVPLSGGATSVPSAAAPLPSMNAKAYHETYANTLLLAMVVDGGLAIDAATAKAYVDSKTGAEIASFVRSKSGAEVIATALKIRPAGLAKVDGFSAPVAAGGAVSTPASAPIPEGTVIPVDVIDTFKKGAFNNVPVLAGNTRDEGKLFGTLPPIVFGDKGPNAFTPLYKMTDKDRFMAMKNFDPNAAVPNTTLADQINAAFLPLTTPPGKFSGTDYNAWTNIYGRVIFTTLGDERTQGVLAEALNALKTVQPNVFYAMFNWDEEPAPWNDVYGAAHGFDIPFWMGNFSRASLFSNTVVSKANEKGRLELSDAMISSLSAFARTGNPNNDKLGVTWPVWPKQVNFDASLTAKQITVE